MLDGDSSSKHLVRLSDPQYHSCDRAGGFETCPDNQASLSCHTSIAYMELITKTPSFEGGDYQGVNSFSLVFTTIHQNNIFLRRWESTLYH